MLQDDYIEFDSFSLVKHLGAGNIGEAYLAYTAEKQLCVVRILSRLPELGDNEIDAFLEKVAETGQCQSPHIPEVIEYGIAQDGMPYLAYNMAECACPGTEVVRTGPMSESKALDLALQTAHALRNLWADNQRIHGCIRPSNILLDAEGKVVLSDAGDDKRLLLFPGVTLDQLDDAGNVADFMSVEHADDIELDVHSDMYSLGATLFFYLTGRAPFKEKTTRATLRVRLDAKAPDIRSVRSRTSRHISKLVADLMNSESPFRNWDEVCAAIQAIVARSAGAVGAASSKAGNKTPIMLWAGAGGALLLAILFAIIMVVVNSGGDDPPAPTPPPQVKKDTPGTPTPAPVYDGANHRREESSLRGKVARIIRKFERNLTSYDERISEMNALQATVKSAQMRTDLDEGIAKLKKKKAELDAMMKAPP
jgi:serine/threonine protein kinase